MIQNTATDTLNYSRKVSFAESARACWWAVLNSLSQKPKVLLPNYIGITDREGSGIFDPISDLALDYGFYELEDNLSISPEKLKLALEHGNYDVVLFVHYFGQKIQNIEQLVKLAKSHQLLVVEDCAHLYNYNTTGSNAGSFGDFTFYSLHKNFPMPEGGMLVQNNETLEEPQIQVQAKREFAKELFAYDAQAIAVKRINNYKVYDRLIPEMTGIRPLRSYQEGDLPHNYPVVIDDGLRESLYFWLIDKNVRLMALYYRLIDPILADERHKNMHKLANDILNLPVHQDTKQDDIVRLVELIDKGIKALKA